MRITITSEYTSQGSFMGYKSTLHYKGDIFYGMSFTSRIEALKRSMSRLIDIYEHNKGTQKAEMFVKSPILLETMPL